MARVKAKKARRGAIAGVKGWNFPWLFSMSVWPRSSQHGVIRVLLRSHFQPQQKQWLNADLARGILAENDWDWIAFLRFRLSTVVEVFHSSQGCYKWNVADICRYSNEIEHRAMRLNYSTSTCSNLPRIMKQIETDWNHMNIWTSLVFTQVCFGIAKSHVTHFSCPKLDDEISRSAGLRDNLLDSSPFAAYSLDLPRNAQAVGPFFVLPKPPAAGNCFVCWIWGICLKNRVWQNWGELHCHTERLQCEYVSAECSLPFGMFIPWLFIGISNHFFPRNFACKNCILYAKAQRYNKLIWPAIYWYGHTLYNSQFLHDIRHLTCRCSCVFVCGSCMILLNDLFSLVHARMFCLSFAKGLAGETDWCRSLGPFFQSTNC